jgi:NADH-quinone oxidoreductase subunit C
MADGLVLTKLREKFPDRMISTHSYRGDDTALVKKESILDVLSFLKEDKDMSFEMLMDLTAVDYLKYVDVSDWVNRITIEKVGELKAEHRSRFEVVYHLCSISRSGRVRIKAPVEEGDPTISSATSLWPIANWLEREVWDMFGIAFKGHPNLKRLLMYEGFQGHPLRKDYPKSKRQPLIGPKN